MPTKQPMAQLWKRNGQSLNRHTATAAGEMVAALEVRNVVIRDRVTYEQGIHVFAQPVMGPAGLAGYSLAVTGTTSLAFSNGVPENGDTRELYRSTRLLYVPILQLNRTVAELVRQLANEQFQAGR